MNFTVLTPNDTPVMYGISDATDSNFGGQRARLHQTVGDDSDYTVRKGEDPNFVGNPIDDAVRDIDDMSNLAERKNEFSQQEIRMNVQEGNESRAIQSDPDNRPRMDEGADGVQVPSSNYREEMKKKVRWTFDSSPRYEGEVS